MLRNRPFAVLRPPARNVRITVAPRFDFAFPTARPVVIGVRQTETGALSRSILRIASARADGRVVRRPPQRTEPRPPAGAPVAAMAAAVHAFRLGRIEPPRPPLDHRPAGGFLPVEMIAHRPSRAPVVDPDAEPRFEPPRTRAAAGAPAEEGRARALQLDAIDMNHLTDRMIEELDRRAFAAHERMNRR